MVTSGCNYSCSRDVHVAYTKHRRRSGLVRNNVRLWLLVLRSFLRSIDDRAYYEILEIRMNHVAPWQRSEMVQIAKMFSAIF